MQALCQLSQLSQLCWQDTPRGYLQLCCSCLARLTRIGDALAAVTIAGGKPARGLICASYGPFRQAVSIQTPPQAAGGDRRGLPSSSPMTGRFCMVFCGAAQFAVLAGAGEPLLSTLLSSFLLSSFYLFVYLHLRATRKWTHLQVDPLDSQRAWLRQHAPVAFSASNPTTTTTTMESLARLAHHFPLGAALVLDRTSCCEYC